jgi:hypothetical protein
MRSTYTQPTKQEAGVQGAMPFAVRRAGGNAARHRRVSCASRSQIAAAAAAAIHNTNAIANTTAAPHSHTQHTATGEWGACCLACSRCRDTGTRAGSGEAVPFLRSSVLRTRASGVRFYISNGHFNGRFHDKHHLLCGSTAP